MNSLRQYAVQIEPFLQRIHDSVQPRQGGVYIQDQRPQDSGGLLTGLAMGSLLGGRGASNVTVVNNMPGANGGGTGQASENNGERNKTAAVIGGALALVSALGLGCALGTINDAREDLDQSQAMVDLAKTLLQLLQPGEDVGPAQHFLALAELQLAIDTRRYEKSRNYLIAAGGGLGGGIALFAGALASSGIVLVIGAIVALAAAIFALINFGLHCNDSSKDEKARIAALPKLGEFAKVISPQLMRA